MNAIWTLAKKDLLLLWRDRLSMFWMLGFPLIFAAFFGSIFGGSGPGASNPMQVAIVADGLDDAARKFVERLDASDAVETEEMPREAAVEAVRKGRKVAFLDVKRMPGDGFAMFAGDAPEIEIGIDPSRQAEKGFLQGLVMEAAFAGFQDLFADPALARAEARKMIEDVRGAEDVPVAQKLVLSTFFAAMETFFDQVEMPSAEDGGAAFAPRVETVSVVRERTGPPNAYSVSFPQSILWAVMGAAAGFAITLVRERSSGTMVRLLTAPVSRGAVLAGKAFACFLTGCAVVAILMVIGWTVFGVRVGDMPLLVLATACAAACFAGISMFLSALGRTEAAVGGLAWGVLIVFAMLGGGMVPQFVMPPWMLAAGSVSPARWTIQALEGAIWRGFSPADMLLPCAMLLGMGAIAFAFGAWRLRRE